MIPGRLFSRVFAAVFGVALAADLPPMPDLVDQPLVKRGQHFGDKLRQRRKARARVKPRQGTPPKMYGNNRARRHGFKRVYR